MTIILRIKAQKRQVQVVNWDCCYVKVVMLAIFLLISFAGCLLIIVACPLSYDPRVIGLLLILTHTPIICNI